MFYVKPFFNGLNTPIMVYLHTLVTNKLQSPSATVMNVFLLVFWV